MARFGWLTGKIVALSLSVAAVAQAEPKIGTAVSITREAEPKAAAPAARAMSAAAEVGRTPTADEMQLLAFTNQARAIAGLAPLTWNVNLAAAAQEHSDDLAAHGGNCPSLHDSCDGTAWSKRVGRYYPCWVALAENAAEGLSSAQSLHDGWMASSGHRANILSPFVTEFGAAIALGQTAFGKIAFATEDFGSCGAIGPTPKPGPTVEPTPRPSPHPTHTKTPHRTPRPTRTPKPKPSRTSGHR